MQVSRVTIRDIAREADVSIATVSKYLSGRTDMREKNIAAIQSAIERLDYKVNLVARSLAQKPIKLGVLLPSTFDEYFDSMLEGMKSVVDSLADRKLTAIYARFNGYRDDAAVIDTLNSFIDQGVNGIILAPSRFGNLQGVVKKLEKKRIPVVFVVSDLKDAHRLACIGIDASLSGRLAADFAGFAMRPGAAAAVFIGNRDIVEHQKKAECFIDSCREKKLYVCGAYETLDDSDTAYQLAKEAIQENAHLELIYVATGNSVAVCRAIRDCGAAGRVRVIATDARRELKPFVEDGTVIGVLSQHLHTQGSIAVNVLFRYLTENVLEQDEVLLSPTLLLKSTILKKWE